jgi:2'-5' RNA ligase
MRQAALPKLARGEADLDYLLDVTSDDRRGITLLARPPAPLLAAIEAVLADFRQVEPHQYYYPATDIHLTILSLISCYAGFELRTIDPNAYREVLQPILAAARPFRLTFSGLTASPGGLMVQGYPQGEGLEELRNAIRVAFQGAGLPQSIDQRYRLHTAHATVVRFRRPLQQPEQLLQKTAQYQHYFIGTFEVNTVELVYNDWYQRAANTVLLARYALGTAP